jgi:hypothetical protein
MDELEALRLRLATSPTCNACGRPLHRPGLRQEREDRGVRGGVRHDARYCSNACRQKAYRERKK